MECEDNKTERIIYKTDYRTAYLVASPVWNKNN